MEKFQYAKIDEYLSSKNYTAGTSQSQRSVLTELYNMVNVYSIDESIDGLYKRATIGKSPKTSKMIKSVYNGFSDFMGNISTSTPISSSAKKPEPKKAKTFEELKEQFKQNVLKISKDIKEQQKQSEIDKIVSFYIREGKQLIDLFGYLSESALLQTIHARFNKKPSDVQTVKNIISKYIPSPSTKTFKKLPKQGKFLEFVLDQGAKTMTKDQIVNNMPLIDPNSLNVEDYIPQHDPKYIWLENERDLITTLLLLNENLWVTGSAGLGKSSMLLQFAFEEKIPIVRTGCNYEADPNDNYFKQSFNGSKVVYQMQNAGKAFMFASMVGASINAQEELNSANEATMISMHSATDSIKSLDTEIGKIELSEGVKCLIAGTGNIGYKGTSDLTPALQSRLIPFEKQEPTDEFILENIWN